MTEKTQEKMTRTAPESLDKTGMIVYNNSILQRLRRKGVRISSDFQRAAVWCKAV